MDAVILAIVFIAAVSVAGGVVLAFSPAVDDVLPSLVPASMLRAWSLFVKFAVFSTILIGGLRLAEVGALVSSKSPGAAPLGAGASLMEVYKSIAGSLQAGVWALLVFFGTALVVYAALRIYEAARPALAHSRGIDRHAAHGPRASVPEGRA